MSAEEVGLKYGCRSGLEGTIADQIARKGLVVDYESTRVPYTRPASKHTYTPDFILPSGIIVETKGRFVSDDRKKHLLIKQQHPTLDVRFVFSNPKAKLYKSGPTTYAMWCDKHGFRYAKGTIPDAWFLEEGPQDGPT